MSRQYDVVIIGAGPAGCSAALMAKSLNLSFMIIEKEKEIGGQLKVIEHFSNFFSELGSGRDLRNAIHQQFLKMEIRPINAMAQEIVAIKSAWQVALSSGMLLECDVVVIATGASDVLATDHPLIEHAEIDMKPFYMCNAKKLSGKKVLIIGGDRPLYTVASANKDRFTDVHATVLALPESWHISSSESLSKLYRIINVERILSIKKVKDKVECVFLNKDGVNETTADRVYMNLGKKPNSDLIKNHVVLDSNGYVMNPFEYEIKKLYVVGDVAHMRYQRIATAVGEGSRVILDYYYRREKLINQNE